MIEIEDASVVSGAINGLGHLILTTHGGDTIDAGYALVAVPDATDTVRGVSELATEAETAAHTDNSRAVTPASLASSLARVTALEAEPGERVQTIAPPAESAGPGSYPAGVSIMSIYSGSGWSVNAGFGTIVTINHDGINRVYQTLTSTGGGAGVLVKVWSRTYHTPEGWTPWQSLANPADPVTMGITGEIKMWAPNSVPTGWQLCDGSAISRTANANLFAALGTTYGVGDGSTTFNVPNLKGRIPTGLDTGQTEFNAMGKTGGEKTHLLTTAEMPSHTHIQDGHQHQFAGNGALTDGPSGVLYVVGNTPAFYGFRATQPSVVTAVNQSTGGGGAHNNLQPYIVVRYIIKL
jgi:microcystin-dependent protein